MRKPAPQRRFASVEERVAQCPSWVQQDFAQLDAACRRAAPDVDFHDAARAEGRVYYCGAKHVKFCRIDPNTRRIGVWFRTDILAHVERTGKLRRNRPDGPWIYVERGETLDLAIALIRESRDAALAK
jgi:hypothetical protein